MSKKTVKQIQEYLESGGLFNPELMDHDKVRDLLISSLNDIKKLKYRLSMMKKIRNEKLFEKLIDALEEKEKLYKYLQIRDDFLVENGLWNKFIEYTKGMEE